MKKHRIAQRRLVLRKEHIQIMATKELEAVIGGVPSNTIPTCLTMKCVTFNLACP